MFPWRGKNYSRAYVDKQAEAVGNADNATEVYAFFVVFQNLTRASAGKNVAKALLHSRGIARSIF